MNNAKLVVIYDRQKEKKLVVDTLEIGKVTKDGGFLGERPATKEALEDFLRIANRSSHHIVCFQLPDQRYYDTLLALSDIVGKSKRVFIDGDDILLECQLTKSTHHRRAGFAITTEMLTNELEANTPKVTNVMNIEYFVQFSNDEEL